jgi:3,4-dihydroxy 2-butanone 4-phosphate synthase/GTP cyclohydrolase II
LRGQDHPTADSDLPLGSVAAAEIISTELSRVALADTFLNDEDDAELDLDSPTEGFASIADAIEDIRQGKVSMPCNSLLDRVSVTHCQSF